MKDIFIGYINYENKTYTFNYENKKLILICTENSQTFFSEYKYIDYFEGFTIDGFNIIFYMCNNIYYQEECFIGYPRCILIA